MTTPERLCGSKRSRGDEETPIYIDDDETDNDSDEGSEEEDDDEEEEEDEEYDDYYSRRRRHFENWMSSIIGRSVELQREGSPRPHPHHHHHQTTTRTQEQVPPSIEESGTSNDEREQIDTGTTGSQIIFHSIRAPNVSVFIRPTGISIDAE